MFNHILIPTDGSPLSGAAVEQAMRLARQLRSKVTFITVTEPFDAFSLDPDKAADTPVEYRKHRAEAAARILAASRDSAKEAGVSANAVRLEDQDPYEAIIRSAEQLHCDLIVMASHGRRGISAVLLGSVTVKVLTHSTIPVLVFRGQSAAEINQKTV